MASNPYGWVSRERPIIVAVSNKRPTWGGKMGYYTDYELYICDLNTKTERKATPDSHREIYDAAIEIAHEFEEMMDEDYIHAKWDDHESHMRILSLHFPNVLFKLTGEGEDNSDVWHKYFFNTKMQICRATLTVPEFDAKQLE